MKKILVGLFVVYLLLLTVGCGLNREEFIFENVYMLLTGIEFWSIITEAKTCVKKEAQTIIN